MKYLIIIFIILSFSYSKSLEEKKENFSVCVRDDLFPIDGIIQDSLSGISGTILNEIAMKSNLKFNLIQTENKEQLLSLIKDKKCDILTIVPQNVEEEIKKEMISSTAYIQYHLAIITKINKPFEEDTKSFYKNKFLTKNDSLKKYLHIFYPKINIEINNDLSYIFEKLEKEEIDGFVTDNITANKIVQKFGYEKFKISEFLGKERSLSGSFGVINTKPELLKIINIGLEDFSKEDMINIRKAWDIIRYEDITDNNLALKLSFFFFIVYLFILIFLIFLKKHNTELKEWLNSTIEGVAIFEKGKIVRANEEFINLFGYSKFSEIEGKTAFDFVSLEDYVNMEERLKSSQEPYEMIFIKKDKTKFEALVKANQIEGTDKRISTIIDISKLKNTQKELRNLNIYLEERVQKEIEKNKIQQAIMFHQSRLAEIGSTLSMIAHQWRQPLNNISLIVNTIVLKEKKGNLNLDDLNKLKNEFQNQIKYLSNTIDDFQDFFKPKKEKEFFSIQEIITIAYSLIKPMLDINNIIFKINVDSNLRCFGFKNEFAQVILNLLNNSKDALIENNILNRYINIFTRNDENYLMVVIQDNAKGIKEELLEKVFEPYFSTKSNKNSTGLGLYISKIIINNHFNGKIELNNIKNGLEVIISIPKNIFEEGDFLN
jgi:PAS domain S-box-containing protein